MFEKLQDYRDFVDTFPIVEDSEIFGMHENANIAYQVRVQLYDCAYVRYMLR